jgi:hypothetical protein
MASAAPIQVEPRAKTRIVAGYSLVLVELRQSSLKERQIVGISSHRSKWLAGIDAGVAAYSRVALGKCRSSEEQQCQGND